MHKLKTDTYKLEDWGDTVRKNQLLLKLAQTLVDFASGKEINIDIILGALLQLLAYIIAKDKREDATQHLIDKLPQIVSRSRH